jgi:hypothetical protein
MYIEAKLVFRYYVPEDYSSMLFLSMRKNHVPFVYSIENLRDAEKYIEINGYPVRPYIILEGNPNLSNSIEILAQPEQIGWFDAGPDSEDLVDIELKQFNDILEFDNGDVLIEVDDDTDDVVLFQDKVTLMYVDSLDDDDYELDDDADNEPDDDSLFNNFNHEGGIKH